MTQHSQWRYPLVQYSPQHTLGILAQQAFNTGIFSIWEWGEFKSFDVVVHVGPVQTIMCLDFCLGKNTGQVYMGQSVKLLVTYKHLLWLARSTMVLHHWGCTHRDYKSYDYGTNNCRASWCMPSNMKIKCLTLHEPFQAHPMVLYSTHTTCNDHLASSLILVLPYSYINLMYKVSGACRNLM